VVHVGLQGIDFQNVILWRQGIKPGLRGWADFQWSAIGRQLFVGRKTLAG